jgi:peptide/nickel transport system permease protein
VIDALDTSYCEAARLKGCSPARVVLRHALPNAIGPIANAIALSLSTLLRASSWSRSSSTIPASRD